MWNSRIMRSRTSILIFVLQLTSISSLAIIDTIRNNTEFYYKQLPAYPSKSATIEYFVTYNYTKDKLKCDLCYPRLEIYTTADDKNIKKRCSIDSYGQLKNENLYISLKLRSLPHHLCNLDQQDGDIAHCHGKTTIQDYTPRNFAFSFGSRCEYSVKGTLKDLTYNISIYDQTNETYCSPTPSLQHDFNYHFQCKTFYSHTSLPNLFGYSNWEAIQKWIKIYFLFDQYSIEISQDAVGRCYPYFKEFLCYLTLPNCDPVKKQVIHLCKETCHEFLEACADVLISFTFKFRNSKPLHERKFSSQEDVFTVINCDYLPSVNGSIPCFYKPVTCEAPLNVDNAGIYNDLNFNKTFTAKSQVEYYCVDETFQMTGNKTITCHYSGQWSEPPECVIKCKAPPNVTNAIILSDTNTNKIFTFKSQVGYVCQDETFQMEGNKTITCLYSGQWSQPPQCIKKPTSSGSILQVVLPLLLLPCLTLTIIILVINCKREKLPALTRMKKYDAFVCYAYKPNDQYFAEKIVPRELEERLDTPFKLCIHRRDFLAAWDIMWNIDNAIKNSNSAIIVMSQDYVNSLWCKEEFEQCYMEHMKDPAFKLFVVMMQPVETLEKKSVYMERFFSHKTYLTRDEPKLFKKIGEYLRWVKKPKKGKNPDIRRDNQETEAEEENAEIEELLL